MESESRRSATARVAPAKMIELAPFFFWSHATRVPVVPEIGREIEKVVIISSRLVGITD